MLAGKYPREQRGFSGVLFPSFLFDFLIWYQRTARDYRAGSLTVVRKRRSSYKVSHGFAFPLVLPPPCPFLSDAASHSGMTTVVDGGPMEWTEDGRSEG